ncbi:MAG TPA: translesion error-prone DNA polymerase V autoproteolytic subunit [Pyrinomonadaceae bacterium]|nr:translesion error-prone DNA polymerase V autoproteolytic subunit [Pyrinomonadaceae bacterium]
MNVAVIWTHERRMRLLRPLLVARVSAGFPSPADDLVEGRIDLNRHLVRHPAATFYMRVIGDSMSDDIREGDILVVDRACEAEDGDIVVVRLANDFTVKRLSLSDGRLRLLSTNEAYAPIEVTEEADFEVWGKVVWSIRGH